MIFLEKAVLILILYHLFILMFIYTIAIKLSIFLYATDCRSNEK